MNKSKIHEPKISIIIPTYNGEATLRKCLGSVLNQNFKDYEVVIVNNNSNDKTKNIILEFQRIDNRIKYIFEPHKGRGKARNAGIRESKGKIIVMTDSDCLVPKNWIKNIIKPIISDKEDIVQGNEEDLIGNYWTKMQQKANCRFFSERVYNTHYINHVDTKNFAIKKEVLEKVGFFDNTLKNFEDFDLKVRLKKKGYKIYFFKSLKVKHHHRDNFLSLVKRRFNQGYWITKIYFKHKSFFNETEDEMVKSLQLTNFMLFFPWLFLVLLKKGISTFFFELITGVAWRIGIFCALFI